MRPEHRIGAVVFFGALAVVIVAILATCVAKASATDIRYTCQNITGVILAAPSWKPEPDGFADRTVTLVANLETGKAGAFWSNGLTLTGVRLQSDGGFTIVAVGGEWLEVYTVNTGSLDLMLVATRSGSPLLPNSAKAFHGTCRPGVQP